MKYWAIFYEYRTCEDGSHFWWEPCGDRKLIQIDGRLSVMNMDRIARDECKHRGFDGYQIHRGTSLLNLFALQSNITMV